jgi:lysophospholipase L1-like esterase
MFYKIIAIPLLPIFLFQGKKVKKNIPKLPEAEGVRSGVVGKGKKVKLLILGDSAAAGVGTDIQENALSGQLIGLLRDDYKLSWELVAKSGKTTEGAIRDLNKIDSKSINYDIVIISSGVNDVLSKLDASKWVKQVEKLTNILKNDFNSKLILFTNVPPMGKFTALPQPLRWYLGSKSNEFNMKLDQIFKNTDGVYNFNIDFKDTKSSLAVDGFHPSKHGYKLWAEALSNLIKKYMPIS